MSKNGRLHQLSRHRVVVFVDEANGDVDNIPSDGDGLDGDDETSDESEDDSDVSITRWVALCYNSMLKKQTQNYWGME